MNYFYNTWWFYLICSLLMLVVGYIIFKLKLLQLERTNLQINQLLLSKIAELQDNPQGIKTLQTNGQPNGQKDEQMLAVLLHDIRSPLRFMCTISQVVLKEFSNGSMENNQDHLIKLNKSLGALRSFVEQSYLWMRSNDKHLQLSIRQVAIQDVFNKIHGFYCEFFQYNGNQLIITPTDIAWTTDQDVLCLILRNLLDNANKYTEGGRVWLSCHAHNDKLCIEVKDSGEGLNERQIQAFLQPCKQNELTGMGSQLISRMLNKINGRLIVTSQLGKGSVFTVELAPMPIKNSFSFSKEPALMETFAAYRTTMS